MNAQWGSDLLHPPPWFKNAHLGSRTKLSNIMLICPLGLGPKVKIYNSIMGSFWSQCIHWQSKSIAFRSACPSARPEKQKNKNVPPKIVQNALVCVFGRYNSVFANQN